MRAIGGPSTKKPAEAAAVHLGPPPAAGYLTVFDRTIEQAKKPRQQVLDAKHSDNNSP
jgi:hypothetical protein